MAGHRDHERKTNVANGDRDSKHEYESNQEAERKQEFPNAADKALAAQTEANKLTHAAAAAGDPEERQKLLNRALNKEIEAQSFGKTVKYLNSGAFQGLITGSSIGVGLGIVTGTLVGGVGGLVTGGLGAGVGALTGPFFKLGDVAGSLGLGEMVGDGVRKMTGTLRDCNATPEQKRQLEKMVGQANEQERPSENELKAMSSGQAGAGASAGDSWKDYAPVKASSPVGTSGKNAQQAQSHAAQGSESEMPSTAQSSRTSSMHTTTRSSADQSQPASSVASVGDCISAASLQHANLAQAKKRPRKLEHRRATSPTSQTMSTAENEDVSNLQRRSGSPQYTTLAAASAKRRYPRKLEIRSKRAEMEAPEVRSASVRTQSAVG